MTQILGQPCEFQVYDSTKGWRPTSSRSSRRGAPRSCRPRWRRRPPSAYARAVRARKVSGWPKRCKLADVSLWKYSYKRLKLAQLLGQLGVFLTVVIRPRSASFIRRIAIPGFAPCVNLHMDILCTYPLCTGIRTRIPYKSASCVILHMT